VSALPPCGFQHLKAKIRLRYILIFSSFRPVNTLRMGYKNQLMPYREITAVCSEIHTKYINTLCGQNVELTNVKLAVHEITTGI